MGGKLLPSTGRINARSRFMFLDMGGLLRSALPTGYESPKEQTPSWSHPSEPLCMGIADRAIVRGRIWIVCPKMQNGGNADDIAELVPALAIRPSAF